MDFYSSFLSTLESQYPETARAVDLREKLSPLLFCPHVIKLPSKFREQAIAFASAAHRLRELETRKTKLEALEPRLSDPGNYSALMSHDFHVDSEGWLRLIEINTNASMSLMSDLLYEMRGLKNSFTESFPRAIIETFKEEFRLSARAGRRLERVVIVDETPTEQRAFAEFHAYRELFAREGLQTHIADTRDLTFEGGELRLAGQRVDLVYNRDTDFYLETERTNALREAMVNRAACLSPHPHEYRLLADKDRLRELSLPGAIDTLALSEADRAVLRAAIVPTFEVTSAIDPDELWSRRKHLFFKPKRSFGGKAVYRGASISRPMFAQILAGEYLAQELVPPATIAVPGADGAAEEFKYDLRFYVYRDRIQLACARLYRGQMTNSHTPGGGLAAIEWA